jgi:hypothetical protein
MAIYGRKEKKLRRDISKKQAYAKYFKGMRASNKQPMTYANWLTGGRRQGYLGAAGGTTATAKLRRKERKALGMKD